MDKKTSILLILLISLLLFGFISSRLKKKKLNQCSIDKKAVVIDRYHVRKQNYSVRYEYLINGNNYIMSESFKTKLALDTLGLGDTVVIKVSCEDPNISQIIW